MKSDYILLLQAAVGTVLIVAAMTKLRRGRALEPFLLAVGIQPNRAAFLSSMAGPLEAVVGIALLAGIFAIWVSQAAAAMGLAFVGLHVIAIRKGVTEGCRCFGALDSTESLGFSLARAILLAAAAAVLAGAHVASNDPVGGGIWSSQSDALGAGALTGIAALGIVGLLSEVWSFEHRRPRALLATAHKPESPPEVWLYGGAEQASQRTP